MLLETPMSFTYASLDEAFPTVDCCHEPLGSRVIVQVRKAKNQTAGGIYIPEEARKTEAVIRRSLKLWRSAHWLIRIGTP